MSKDKIEVDAKVLEVCQGGQFRCEVPFGDTTREVMAYASGKMRKFSIRIVVGDKVVVEMSPYDLSKGRIVYRDRN